MPVALPVTIAISLALLLPANAAAQFDIEEPPFNYTETKDDNPVTQLMERYSAGDADLEYDRSTGYLRSILKSLDVHESSQALVFSKTSLQVRYISPRNPRAIYFNDDVYVGWVRGSEIMELSTSDPKLGAAFYTVTMSRQNAEFKRAGYDCLGCHATSMTQGIPGHTVRSVFASLGGSVDPKQRSFVTDHTSPFSERWGGWYVTGLHGDMTHMGNAFLRNGQLDTQHNSNRQNLRDEFQTIGWLSSYSDIVALMVLEHQTQMHNIFTKADFTVRRAKFELQPDSATDGEIQPEAQAELQLIVAEAAKDVVDYMLFANEAPLTSEVKGSIIFKGQFRRRGPDDFQGRSLREFNLQTRLFQYPCSYLIYSQAFDKLQQPLRNGIYAELWSVLNSEEQPPQLSHLDGETRDAIKQILRDTKPGLAKVWHEVNHANSTETAE